MDEFNLLIQRVDELEKFVDSLLENLFSGFPKDLYENKIEVLNKKIANLEAEVSIANDENHRLRENSQKALQKMDSLYNSIVKIKKYADS
jgi:predicted  nucleic acid-binding Zn-ribbon protein